MQNWRFSDGVLVSAVGIRAVPVDARTMVLDTQGSVHEQNDVHFDRENNGFRLGVFNCNGHHAIAGHIELFHDQVNEYVVVIKLQTVWR